MKILREGHRYELENFGDKNSEGQIIQFIEKYSVENFPEELKEGRTFSLNNPTDLITAFDGTTNEELLEVLINRMNFLQSKFPCRENACAITKLDEALMWLEKRTKDRIKRNVEGKHIK